MMEEIEKPAQKPQKMMVHWGIYLLFKAKKSISPTCLTLVGARVLWKETTLKLPSCECCGHVFAEDEKAYLYFRPGKVRVMQFGNPTYTDIREKPRYRCQACYEAMWH